MKGRVSLYKASAISALLLMHHTIAGAGGTPGSLMQAVVGSMQVNSWAQVNQNVFSDVATPPDQRPTPWDPASKITGCSGSA